MLNRKQCNKINSFSSPPVIVLAGNVGALAVIRNLGKNNVPVIGLSDKEFILKSKFCIGIKIKKDISVLKILLELTKLIKGKMVIFTDADDYMTLICENWEQLKEHYILPIGNNWEVYKSLTSKELLAQSVKKVDLKVPVTYVGDLQYQAENFPVLVKPLKKDEFFNKYFAKAVYCSNYLELKEVLRIANGLGGSITQEIIEGETDNLFCITLYRNRFGRIIIGNVVRKIREYPNKFGTGTVHLTCNNKEVINKSVLLLNSLNFIGVAIPMC